MLVAKHQRRLPGFDDHVVGMYARGMSVCEIQGYLLEPYAQEVSPSLISTITDKVMAQAKEWFITKRNQFTLKVTSFPEIFNYFCLFWKWCQFV